MALVETAKFPGAVATESDMLNWKNVVPSGTVPTLAASLASIDTSATVATGTGAGFPTDNFTITIDDETIFVTSRSGDTLSLGTRGYEGSVAATHASGATVRATVTAKAHNQLVSEVYAIESQLGVNLNNVVKASTRAAANGVAPLDSTSRVPTANLPSTLEYTTNKGAASGYAPLDSSSLVPVTNLPSTLEFTTNKGVANGYASLDSLAKIVTSQLPDTHTVEATITADITLSTPAERGPVYPIDGSGGASITVTLPDAGANPVDELVFIRTDAGTNLVILQALSSQSVSGQTTYKLVNQYQYVRLVSLGAVWAVVGNN